MLKRCIQLMKDIEIDFYVLRKIQMKKQPANLREELIKFLEEE